MKRIVAPSPFPSRPQRERGNFVDPSFVRRGRGGRGLQKTDLTCHFLRGGRFRQTQQGLHQPADIPVRRQHDAGVCASLRQITSVQSDKVTDVVGHQYAAFPGGVCQHGFVIPTPLIDVVDTCGINVSPSHLRGQIGVYIFVDEEGYADGGEVPSSIAASSSRISSWISARWS